MLFSIVAGSWSSWTSTTSCSSTCGIGTQSLIRTCTSPRPCGGGANCSATDPFDLTGTQYQMITASCILVVCPPPPPIGELFFFYLKLMKEKVELWRLSLYKVRLLSGLSLLEMGLVVTWHYCTLFPQVQLW